MRAADQQPADDTPRVLFEWVGDTARHVGTVVHRCLERIANGEDIPADFDPAPWLREQGVLREEMNEAIERVRQAVNTARQSAKAKRLLQPNVTEARNEWALSGLVDGRLVHATLDRSFVDGNGTHRGLQDFHA